MTEMISPPWFARPRPNGVAERDSPSVHEMDRDELQTFFENANQQLANIGIGVGFTYDLANALTKTLMESLFHESEWRELASAMGFKDLNEITYYAELNKAHPFNHFLTKKLRHSDLAWDSLIRVLIDEERFDLLEKLQPFISGILVNTSESSYNASENQYGYNNLGSQSVLSMSDVSTVFESQSSSIEDNTQVSMDELSLISREASSHLDNESESSYQVERAQTANGMDLGSPRTQCLADYFKSGKANNEISVFISHTDEDYELAAEVADKLRQNGFVVFVQGEQDGAFALDECLIVKKIVKHMDFFVPLVTKTYLRQIDISSDFEDSRLLVRYLFYNFQSQFVEHQCVNRYIKPLVVQDVDKRKVKKHVELRCGMILWKQFDRFCNLLVETKRINQMLNSNS